MLENGVNVEGYRIDRLIGEGGMGVVYEATQLSLDRKVALKLLSAELSVDAGFRERFRHEARIQGALDHPNIVTVHEAGESDYGLFIAMELIRGATLKDLIVGRELDAGRTLRIVSQVAEALDSAHDAGLIHRDIKPHNILVRAGRRDHAYLADFGVTKVRGGTNLTKTGHFVGTVDYMAPEQIRGEPATRETDIYALGTVLYECLSGAVPFPKDSDVAVMYAHLADPPPRLTEERPELPPELDAVISKALAKNPGDRYSSAARMMESFEEALGDQAKAAITIPPPVGAPEELGLRDDGTDQVAPPIPETAPTAPPADATRAAPVQPVTDPAREAPSEVAPADAGLVLPAAATIGSATVAAPGTIVPEPTPGATPPPGPPPAGAPTTAATPVPPTPTAADEPQPTPTAAGAPPMPTPIPAAAGAAAATAAAPVAVAEPAAPPARARAGEGGAPIALIAAIAALVILGLAAAGFVLGHRGEEEATAPAAGDVRSGKAQLAVPSGWQKVAKAPKIPAFPLKSAVAVEAGSGASSVLALGTSNLSYPTFRPDDVLGHQYKRLSGSKTDAVKIGKLQAWRTSNLKNGKSVYTFFTLPQPGNASPTAAVCVSKTGSTSGLQECEGVAGGVRLSNAIVYVISPSSAYGSKLSSQLNRLAQKRNAGRKQLAAASSASKQAKAAQSIAAAYSASKRGAAGAGAPAYAKAVNTKIVSALGAAAGAYQSLASAARAHSSSRYTAASRKVQQTEKSVDQALDQLPLLGYNIS